MKRLGALPVILLLLTAAGVASAQKPAGRPVALFPSLGIAPGGTVAGALLQPFPNSYTVQAVPPATGTHAVRNCADYLALGTGAELSTGSALDDRTLLALGTRCVALSWIQGAHSAATPAAQPGDPAWRTLRLSQLPPALALLISHQDEAVARDATAAGKSILAMEPDLKLASRTATSIRLICPDWTELLTLYARGDFLGTGDEQWIVRAIAGASGATYLSTHLFLLQPGKGGWVVARSYPPAPAR